MRGTLVAAFLVGTMGIVAAASGDNGSDRAAIQQVLDAHGAAWTKGLWPPQR